MNHLNSELTKVFCSEIADHDIGVPIFTTPVTGYRYPHHDNSHEVMQVRMAAMVLSPPTRV